MTSRHHRYKPHPFYREMKTPEERHQELIEQMNKERHNRLRNIIKHFNIDSQGVINQRETWDISEYQMRDEFWDELIALIFREVAIMSKTKEEGKNNLLADMSIFSALKPPVAAIIQIIIEQLSDLEFEEYRRVLAQAQHQSPWLSASKHPLITSSETHRKIKNAVKKMYNVEVRSAPPDKDKISKAQRKEALKDIEECKHKIADRMWPGTILSRVQSIYRLEDMRDVYMNLTWLESHIRDVKREMTKYFSRDALGRG